MSIKKSDNKDSYLKNTCDACGKTYKIDEKEKLYNFIKKNPPKYDKEENKKLDKVDDTEKNEKKLDKETKKAISKYNYYSIVDAIAMIKSLISTEQTDKNVLLETIDKYLTEKNFDIDKKILILFTGLYDKDIYPNFTKWAYIFQHV